MKMAQLQIPPTPLCQRWVKSPLPPFAKGVWRSRRDFAKAKPGGFRRQTGFTLLELVIAITLMGLVLVVLYSGLRLGLNSWDRGEQQADASNRQRLALEFLRRQLAQSMTVYRTNDKQERTVVFTGQANLIELVAPMRIEAGQSGLYRLRLELANSQLQIRFRPYSPHDPITGNERELVVLDGVSALEWAYFGPERDYDPEPPRWRPDWVSSERRPQLVRLNLTVQGEPWPDLVVALVEGPR